MISAPRWRRFGTPSHHPERRDTEFAKDTALNILSRKYAQFPQPLDQQMQNVIEGGNSDYALQKIAYKAGLGRSVISRWQQLTLDEQQRAAQDDHACQQLLKR